MLAAIGPLASFAHANGVAGMRPTRRRAETAGVRWVGIIECWHEKLISAETA